MTWEPEDRQLLRWAAISVTFVAAVIAASLIAFIVSLLLASTRHSGGHVERITVVTVTTTR